MPTPAVSEWADAINRYAEARRGLHAFSPSHPAVRAAKRWCERTGATWEIGVGGRCELGKRAIKQWLYELTLPLRQIRVLLYLIPTVVLALLIGCLILAPIPTLAVGGGVAAFVAIIVGGVTADMQGEGESVLADMSKPLRMLWIGIWVVMLPFALGAYLITRAAQSDFMHRHTERISTIMATVLVVFMVGAVGMLLVTATMYLGWMTLLVWAGRGILALACIGGALVAISKMFDHYSHKLNTQRLEKERAKRTDESVQREARNQLEPALRRYYETVRDTSALSYEEWVAALETLLHENGKVWSDLIRPFAYGRFHFIADDDRFGDAGYSGFAFYAEDLYVDRLTPARRRKMKVRQVTSFIGATLFLFKTQLCPNVILPPKELVES